MSIFTMYKDITVDIPEDIYNKLNRSSREYEMATTDVYYYIMNGNTVQSAIFDEMINDALDAYFAHSKNKDIVSNDFVIPAIKREYNLDGDDIVINNFWNITFDGNHTCNITDIKVSKNDQEVVHEGTVSDEWAEKIGYLRAKIQVYDAIISKIMSSLNSTITQKVRDEYDKVRDIRINLLMEEDVNKKNFLNEIVKPILDEHNCDPEKCTWNLNPIEKTFNITRTVD